VCFVVLHSSQDYLRTRTCDLDHPISYRCKKHQDIYKNDFYQWFLNNCLVLLSPSLKSEPLVILSIQLISIVELKLSLLLTVPCHNHILSTKKAALWSKHACMETTSTWKSLA
jgi:hypothetical protein